MLPKYSAVGNSAADLVVVRSPAFCLAAPGHKNSGLADKRAEESVCRVGFDSVKCSAMYLSGVFLYFTEESLNVNYVLGNTGRKHFDSMIHEQKSIEL